jgi:hypothetical protein
MAALKGNKNAKPGSRKGIPNKTTREFKEALNHFIQNSQENLLDWLEEIELPEKRIDCFVKIAEFVYPKLARTDITSDNKPIQSIPMLVVPQNLSVDEWNKKYSQSQQDDKSKP